MGIDQLVNAYKGNPQPLQAKVQQAQQGQPPGAIPPDLEEAIALQKITEMRQGAQNQQAMQAGGAQPSVVEKLRQMLSAEQRQQAQPPQMPQGPQGGPPQGQPPMPQQPQGVDALPTNVGQQYAHGGIIGNTRHFDEGDLVVDPMGGVISSSKAPSDDLTFLERIGVFNPENRRAIERNEREQRLREAKEREREGLGLQPGQVERGRLPDPRSNANRFPSAEAQLAEAAATAPQPKPSVNVTGGGGNGAKSSASIIDDLVKQGVIRKPGNDAAYQKLAGIMNMDADTEEAKAIAKFKQQVGEKDLSIYDQMAEELKARKERLNAPAKGFDSLMEYLGQIAQGGGGRNWMEAGAKGAAGMTALQKERQAQQDALVDKILDLGAKKKEAEYGQKEKMYDIGQARYKDVFKNTFDAAKDVNKSDDEARKEAIQAVMDQKKIDAQLQAARIGSHDNLMSRAQAIRAENPTISMEEAMRRAALAGGAASVLGTESRDKSKGIDELLKLNKDMPAGLRQGNSAMAQENRRIYNAAVAALESKYGPLTSAGPTASAGTPIPAGAGPSDLVSGTVYQTARGPARWNGKTFDPVQ